MKRTPRIIEPIIKQGIAEEVFTTKFPKQAAEIIVGIALTLTDSITELMFPSEIAQDNYAKLEIILAAYTEAIERILGADAGSLKIFEENSFREWFDINEPK